MYTYDRRRFAMEFPTDEALKKYLKDHPDADKSKHSVKKKEEDGDASSGKPSGSKSVQDMTEGMPDELLSDSEVSNHPAVKKLKKKLLDDLASGKIKPRDLRSAAIELDDAKSKGYNPVGHAKASNALRAYMEALMESEEPRTLWYSKYSPKFFNYKGKELMFKDLMKAFKADGLV